MRTQKGRVSHPTRSTVQQALPCPQNRSSQVLLVHEEINGPENSVGRKRKTVCLQEGAPGTVPAMLKKTSSEEGSVQNQCGGKELAEELVEVWGNWQAQEEGPG